ncbi:hypothetical protein EZJ19_10735 [Parasulfuritortus cantonensis]|uniref:Uncharacterized protein n=1 Tax=Parasulfuritortus cantonensis TaxID=2528202 RepID=A0A4R1B913_9PROT|nr:DUF6502 family protein [Parasulfuritortus cantonensis]TCJ13033.1 hypothetical protein EZJ19_10735 [Parasulfuritortus cantonensis]
MNVMLTVQFASHPALVQAVQRLLRPLARLLMSFGMDFPAFANLAKAVFVDVAARDFPSEGGAITDSRVSLLSGVHRREVKRLRAESLQHQAPPPAVSLGARVIARWCAENAFLDHRRRPAPLPRLASAGGEVSFESLVAGVNKDIRPRAVLDEWLRLGVARLDEDDRVHLAEEAFIPARGLEEKMFYFGKNVSDHLAAGVHNLAGQTPAFLERCVYYDGLSDESVEALRELTRELAVSALQEVNRQALRLQQQDADRQGAKRRMTFGTYFYAEDELGHGAGN